MSKPVSVVLAAASLTLAVVSCGDDEGTGVEETGSIEVTLNMTGSDLDPDGVTIWVNDQLSQALNAGSRVTFSELEPGDHGVRLDDLAGNCAVSGANPRTVTVSARQTAATTFEVACAWIDLIAFRSDRTGDNEIWVMGPDGSNPTNLTNDPGSDGGAQWSPNGTQIAFTSDRTGDVELWVMGVDGSNPINLTNDAGGDFSPRWSPDGTQIAFRSDRTGDSEIWVMAADGSNPTNLTNDGGLDRDPRWSPDGTQIAFGSDRTGDWEI